jgi:hypothetical protein
VRALLIAALALSGCTAANPDYVPPELRYLLGDAGVDGATCLAADQPCDVPNGSPLGVLPSTACCTGLCQRLNPAVAHGGCCIRRGDETPGGNAANCCVPDDWPEHRPGTVGDDPIGPRRCCVVGLDAHCY